MHVDHAAREALARLERREEAEQRDEIDLEAGERAVQRVVERARRRGCSRRDTASAGTPRRAARASPPARGFDAITTSTRAGSPASMCSNRFSRLVPSPESSTATRSGTRAVYRQAY